MSRTSNLCNSPFKVYLRYSIESFILMQITIFYTFHGRQKLYAIIISLALVVIYIVSNLLWIRKKRYLDYPLSSLFHVRYVFSAYLVMIALIGSPAIVFVAAIVSKSFDILMLVPGLVGFAFMHISYFWIQKKF